MAIGKEAQQAIASAKAAEEKKAAAQTYTNTAAQMAQQQGQRTNTYLKQAQDERKSRTSYVDVSALGAGKQETKTTTRPDANYWTPKADTSAYAAAKKDQETLKTRPDTHYWTPTKNTSARMASQHGKRTNAYLESAATTREANRITEEQQRQKKANEIKAEYKRRKAVEAAQKEEEDIAQYRVYQAALGNKYAQNTIKGTSLERDAENLRREWAQGSTVTPGENNSPHYYFDLDKDGNRTRTTDLYREAQNYGFYTDGINRHVNALNSGTLTKKDIINARTDINEYLNGIAGGFVDDIEIEDESGNPKKISDWFNDILTSYDKAADTLEKQDRYNGFVDYLNSGSRTLADTKANEAELIAWRDEADALGEQQWVDDINDLLAYYQNAKRDDAVIAYNGHKDRRNSLIDAQGELKAQEKDIKRTAAANGVETNLPVVLKQQKHNKKLQEDESEAMAELRAELKDMAPDEVKAAIDRLSIAQLGKAYPDARNKANAERMRAEDQAFVDAWMESVTLDPEFYNWQSAMAGFSESKAKQWSSSVANTLSLAMRLSGEAMLKASEDGKIPRIGDKATAEKLIGKGGSINDWAVKNYEDSQKLMNQVKEGKGKATQFGIDVASTMADIGFDTVTQLGLGSMAVRVAGSSAMDYQEIGVDTIHQALGAALNVLLEVGTEKIGGTLGFAYGKGYTDDAIEAVIESLAKTEAGMNGLRLLTGIVSEGGEEVISDLLSPYIDYLADNVHRDEWKYELNSGELLRDFLVGGVAGLFGDVVNAKRGDYTIKNDAILAEDAKVIAEAEEAEATGQPLTEDQLRRLDRAQSRAVYVDERGRVHVNPNAGSSSGNARGNGLAANRGAVYIDENGRTRIAGEDRRDVVIANAAREGVGLNPVEETNVPTREEQIQAEQDKAIEAEEADKAAAEEEYQAEQEARLAGIEEDNRREEESKYTDENDMSSPEPEEDVSDEDLAQIRHDISEEEYLDSLGTKAKPEEPATATETAQGEAQGSAPTEIASDSENGVKPLEESPQGKKRGRTEEEKAKAKHNDFENQKTAIEQQYSEEELETSKGLYSERASDIEGVKVGDTLRSQNMPGITAKVVDVSDNGISIAVYDEDGNEIVPLDKIPFGYMPKGSVYITYDLTPDTTQSAPVSKAAQNAKAITQRTQEAMGTASTAQPQSGTIEENERSESNAEKAITTANTTADELGANRGGRELRSGERANDKGSGKGNARLASRAPRFAGVNAKETRQKWRGFASKIEEAGGRILSAKEYSKAVKKYVSKFKNMFGVPVTVYDSSGMGENAPVGLTTKINPEIGTFIGVNHAKMRRVNGGIANGPGTALFHEHSHQAWSNYRGEATPKSMVTTALKNAKVSKADAVAALYDVLEAYGFRYIQQKGLQNALGIKSKEDWTKLTDQERVNKLNQLPAKMREEIVNGLYEELGNFLITGDVRLNRYNSFKNAAEEARKEAVNIGLYSKIGLDFITENARDFDEAAMQEKEAQEAQADIKKAVDSAKPVSEFDPSDDFAVYSLPSNDDFEKDLVAVRNTSLSSAIRAVKDGGIAMGSIAIAKKTRGHSSFGEVSILFNRDTIDPDKNSDNNVYSVDAYTPVHPKKTSGFSGDVKSLYEYVERLANEFLGSEEYMNQYDDIRTAFFADSYNRDLILAAIASDAKYSLDDLITEAEKNEPVESKDLKDKLSKLISYKTAFDIRKFTEDYSEEYGFSESGYDVISEETGELLLRITFDDLSGEFRPYFDMDDDVRDSIGGLLDKLTDLYIKEVSEEEAEISGAEYVATADLWQALESAAAYQGINDTISAVKSSDKTKNSPEFAASRRKLLYSAIPYNIISPWVDNVIGKFGEYKEGYEHNGKIVDATLDNALEIMRESPRRQSGNFLDNFDSDVSIDDLHTIVSHWFGSFAELKNTEHILTNNREYASYDKAAKNLDALRETLTKGFSKVQNNNSNERSKDFSSIMADFYDREIARESANDFLYDIAHYLEGIKGIRSLTDAKLRSEIAKRLDERGWAEAREGTSYQKAGDIIKVFNEIAELPTGYFEAKPNRVITKDEYAVFLVPKDEENAHYRHEENTEYNKQLQELKALLDSEGIPYIEYDNNHTRRDIMANDLDDIDGVVFEEPYTEEDNSTVNSDLQAENEALKQRIAELEAQQQQPEEPRPQPSTRKKPQQQSLKEDTQTKGSIRNSEERARDIAEEFGLSDGTYQSATRKEVSRIADYCIEKYGMENEWDRLMTKKTWDRVDFSEAGKIVLEMTKNLNRDMTRNGNRGLGKVLEKKAGETYEQYRNRQEAEDKRAYQERREPIDALLQQYADQKSTRGQELQETYNFTFADELRMRASHRFLNSQDGEVRNATDNAKSAKMWAIIDDLVTRVENAEESGSAKDLVEITKMVGRIRGRENLLGKTGTKAENWMFDRMLKLGVEKDALAALAYGNIGKIMDDLTPITYADAIQTVRVTNMLSNIATGLNNLANNAISLRTQSLAQNASIPFAKVFEKLTGKKIAISDSSVFRGKDIRRAEEAALEYSILSSYYGMASEDGRVDLDNKGTNFYVNGTGLSGMAARALARYNFLVQAFVLNPDAPAKARARLGLQKGIEKAFEGAENTPETIRNRKELEGYAAKEANRRVLQEDNAITNAVLYFKNHLLNKVKTPGEHVKVGGRELGSFKLGDFVMAFAKVPTNVGIQKLESTPYGALYQTIRYAGALAKAKANPESLTTNEMARISRDIGRAATTAGMIGLGALAAMTRALKNFDDTDDDEEKKLAREKGYSGLMLNLSQIFHGGEWQDDDLIVSGNFLEILATPLTIGAMMYDASKEGMGFLDSMAYGTKKSFTGMVDAVMDIPGLQQIGDLWTSYANQKPDDGDFDKAMKAIGQFAVSSGTSYFIPNLVAQATAGADNKQRDIYTTDSYAETLRNIAMAKTPGLRKMLPEKTDTLGNTRTYGETKLGGILNTVVFPGDFKRYHVSEVETEMRRLTNEGYGKTWLDTTGPKKVEVDDEEYPLTADQRRAYHEAKAHHLLEAYDAFRTSDEYKNLTDAQRAEVYKQLKTNAEHIVKQEFMTAAEIEGEVNMSKWETLPDLDSKIRALSAKQLAGNYFDKSENEVTDYEGMDKFIKGDYAKLSDEEKDVVNSTYTYLDDIEDARENGIDSEKWEMAHNIFNKYNKPDEDGNKPEANLVNSAEMWSEIQKATGFDDNGKEMQYIQDKMHLSFQGRPNTSTYDELINDYGMSRESAAKVYEKFDPLQPTEGYSTVQDRQKWNALVESGISDKEQWDAFFAMVPTNNTKQIANMHSLQGKMNPRTLKPYTFKEAIHQLELDVVYRKETLPNGKTKKYAIN